jgi:hypothetical protein
MLKRGLDFFYEAIYKAQMVIRERFSAGVSEV